MTKEDLLYILEPLINGDFGWSEEVSKRLKQKEEVKKMDKTNKTGLMFYRTFPSEGKAYFEVVCAGNRLRFSIDEELNVGDVFKDRITNRISKIIDGYDYHGVVEIA